MSELKPCPFCGGGASRRSEWMSDGYRYTAVVCTKCGVIMPGNYSVVGDQATWDWNARWERTCRWVYFDDTVSTSDAYEFGWHYECSECGFDPEELLGADVDHEDELGILVYCPNCGAKVVE